MSVESPCATLTPSTDGPAADGALPPPPVPGLDVTCDRCDAELTDFGGVLIGPPIADTGLVRKLHVCRSCWSEVLFLVDPK